MLIIWTKFHFLRVVVNIDKVLHQVLVPKIQDLVLMQIFAVICSQTVKIQLGGMGTHMPVLIVMQKY